MGAVITVLRLPSEYYRKTVITVLRHPRCTVNKKKGNQIGALDKIKCLSVWGPVFANLYWFILILFVSVCGVAHLLPAWLVYERSLRITIGAPGWTETTHIYCIQGLLMYSVKLFNFTDIISSASAFAQPIYNFKCSKYTISKFNLKRLLCLVLGVDLGIYLCNRSRAACVCVTSADSVVSGVWSVFVIFSLPYFGTQSWILFPRKDTFRVWPRSILTTNIFAYMVYYWDTL
jgi:hypothetical protein